MNVCWYKIKIVDTLLAVGSDTWKISGIYEVLHTFDILLDVFIHKIEMSAYIENMMGSFW